VIFVSEGVRTIYGYQLKSGKEIPARNSNVECERSFVVRGNAPQIESNNYPRSWTLLSDSEIDQFVGVTGRTLVPKQWREMELQVDE
jgi:hypothetical protein